MKTVVVNSPVKAITYMTIGTISFPFWWFAFRFVFLLVLFIVKPSQEVVSWLTGFFGF